MNKYRNRKTTLDKYKFDSMKEARKYQELCLLKHDASPEGVKEFTVHPRFELQPSFSKDGKKYRAIVYIADFDVLYNSGYREIIDIKPFDRKTCKYLTTPAFKLKAKMFDFRYPDLILAIE